MNLNICKYRLQLRLNRSEWSKSSTAVLDLVYCDLQVPISHQCMKGTCYFIPLLYYASGLSMVRIIKSKSDCADSLEEMISQMEKLTGGKLK